VLWQHVPSPAYCMWFVGLMRPFCLFSLLTDVNEPLVKCFVWQAVARVAPCAASEGGHARRGCALYDVAYCHHAGCLVQLGR
jgi:hypothetical protein